jgi:hypothetical protein
MKYPMKGMSSPKLMIVRISSSQGVNRREDIKARTFCMDDLSNLDEIIIKGKWSSPVEQKIEFGTKKRTG